jgi:hypothetical protein
VSCTWRVLSPIAEIHDTPEPRERAGSCNLWRVKFGGRRSRVVADSLRRPYADKPQKAANPGEIRVIIYHIEVLVIVYNDHP